MIEDTNQITTLKVAFAFMPIYDNSTGLTGIGVCVIGPSGNTIGNRTRGTKIHKIKEQDCLVAQDTLDWASQLHYRSLNLLGSNQNITKDLQGKTIRTSWR